MKNEIDILLEDFEYELIFGKQSLLLTVEVGTKKIEKYYKDNYGDRKAEEFLLKFKKNYQEIKDVSDHQLRRVENLTEILNEFEISDKKADRLRLDIFNGIFGRLPYVEVCTERFPDAAYTASEYLDDIYGIVWEGVLKHRPLENFDRALQTAFLESIISTSTATAPIGSFKASKTGFAATGKPEINLAALRNGGKVDMKMYSLQNAEEVAGFSSIPPIYTNQTKIAAYYFDLLMRTKDMLKKAISTAPEADRSHYDLLIYRINKATEIE